MVKQTNITCPRCLGHKHVKNRAFCYNDVNEGYKMAPMQECHLCDGKGKLGIKKAEDLILTLQQELEEAHLHNLANPETMIERLNYWSRHAQQSS